MAERYTSTMALELDQPIEDVGAIVDAARAAGDIDRSAPVRGSELVAREVHWGGLMQKGIVRYLMESGAHLLRTETYLGDEGLGHGIQRQARLLQALSRQCKGGSTGRVVGVRDLSVDCDRDEAWMNRVAIGAVEQEDGIVVRSEGEGTWWTRTHGAARFDIPDLELYGLNRAQTSAAENALRHVHSQLLRVGLTGDLTLPDGTAVYLVPVLEAWQLVPFDWPGVGRAGQERGPGLEGPRATLSLLKGRRFGRYKRDLKGVIAALSNER